MQDWQLKDIYQRFLAWSDEDSSVLNYLNQVRELLDIELLRQKHGEFKLWINLLTELEKFGKADYFDFNNDIITIKNNSINAKQLISIKKILLNLSPWRKGPFDFFGVNIDSEWQSSLKWNRLAPHINLDHKKVLDVGCGNGYYAWHCLGKGADLVLGVDPSLLFYGQFMAFKNAIPPTAKLTTNSLYPITQSIFYLPTTLEDMPKDFAVFDTILSMGVLYHRQSPIEHLQLINRKLKPQGELFLETLIIDGNANSVLVPNSTYAGMPNIWFLPSIELLKIWLNKTGFSNIEVLDISFTSTTEQRRTEFMQSKSLADFLHADFKSTKEGLPPPQRALIKAQKA